MSDLHLDAYNFPQITTATSLFIDIGVGTSREVEGGSKSLVSLCGNRNPTPLPNFLCFFYSSRPEESNTAFGFVFRGEMSILGK